MNDELCHAHSGIATDIKNIKQECSTMKTRIDSIMTRINIILGSLIVSVVLLALNLLLTQTWQ